MKKHILTIASVIALSFSGIANAQMGGSAAPSFSSCTPNIEMNAVTISCANLEVSENGCPSSYSSEGDYCFSDDSSAEHPVVIRNSCDAGFEMVGTKCLRVEASESLEEG